ncbi:IS4 family transposase [Aeoliella sp. ICT_H6.2]|uniref:IS4 family transposase n=1 Tax=Aeoliella straminimaris TaxID=2954799 RepID=A0A9X2FAH9_9BACT|nr:IS4 family transposase [Aeoliella straminimaris]
MRCSNPARFRQQVRFLQRQFLQTGDLPFTDVLSTDIVSQALTAAGVAWKDRLYTPLVTLWIFLGQAMSADHSCRAAVARFVAHRVSRGQRACSSHTGAYCQARKRLPEEFFARIARGVGRALHQASEPQWLWRNRNVYLFDGTTLSMPDTPSNQEAYPQSNKQTPGVGFPLARVAGIFSLSCGAILDLAVAGYSGKGQGEVTLFRQLWDLFRPGDIVLTDALMCNWRNLCSLEQRGVDTVTRLNKALRRADFRRGKRLGKDDHLVRWGKPSMRDVDRETWRSLPDFLTVRECRFWVKQPGFRSREVIIVTTMLDPREVSVAELADLYRMRWNNETDFSSLKVTLQMDVLRCKTPELVRKEIWTHVIAYNLIRTIMAQSCHRAGMLPREISFKATVQILEAFQPFITVYRGYNLADRDLLYEQLIDAIAVHQVGNRPGRSEPRLRKRRFKKYDYMMKPRNEVKLDILKRLTK